MIFAMTHIIGTHGKLWNVKNSFLARFDGVENSISLRR